MSTDSEIYGAQELQLRKAWEYLQTEVIDSIPYDKTSVMFRSIIKDCLNLTEDETEKIPLSNFEYIWDIVEILHELAIKHKKKIGWVELDEAMKNASYKEMRIIHESMNSRNAYFHGYFIPD